MKILRIIIVAFAIWYLPAFMLTVYGETAGSYTSYLMFLMILGYFFLAPKTKPYFTLLFLGFTYFLISGLSYTGGFNIIVFKSIKFMIFTVGISELVSRCKPDFLYFFLLIGALSIIINAVSFSHVYGRYSGFYLNPNLAALPALIGFCFCFKLSNRLLRSIGFIIFIFAGFLTFSRYFILMWILLTIISVSINKKNIEVLGVGIGSGMIILAIASLFQLNTQRFKAIENLFGNQVDQGTKVLSEGSRVETWSIYTEKILDNIIFGNGYSSMSGDLGVSVGVHNSLLLTIGEAGIIPFFVMIILFGRLLYLGLKKIKDELFSGLLSLVLCSYIFVTHNFYDNYLTLFFLIWLSWYLNKPAEDSNSELEPI